MPLVGTTATAAAQGAVSSSTQQLLLLQRRLERDVTGSSQLPKAAVGNVDNCYYSFYGYCRCRCQERTFRLVCVEGDVLSDKLS